MLVFLQKKKPLKSSAMIIPLKDGFFQLCLTQPIHSKTSPDLLFHTRNSDSFRIKKTKISIIKHAILVSLFTPQILLSKHGQMWIHEKISLSFCSLLLLDFPLKPTKFHHSNVPKILQKFLLWNYLTQSFVHIKLVKITKKLKISCPR